MVICSCHNWLHFTGAMVNILNRCHSCQSHQSRNGCTLYNETHSLGSWLMEWPQRKERLKSKASWTDLSVGVLPIHMQKRLLIQARQACFSQTKIMVDCEYLVWGTKETAEILEGEVLRSLLCLCFYNQTFHTRQGGPTMGHSLVHSKMGTSLL